MGEEVVISFILPFASNDKSMVSPDFNISPNYHKQNIFTAIRYTRKCIQNIRELDLQQEYEIIIVDNSHTWIENEFDTDIRVVKGFQGYTLEELTSGKHPHFTNHKGVRKSIKTIDPYNDTMWISLAYHLGAKEAKGDFVILQHTDFLYLNKDVIPKMCNQLVKEKLEYISVDNKKITIPNYVISKGLFDKVLDEVEFSPLHGGCVSTQKGFADAYFFLSKKEFFDDYDVDWEWGDTNHGATIKCWKKNLPYLHLGPYFDNPNFDTDDIMHQKGVRVYVYDSEEFGTHLKGGITENKFEDSANNELFNYNNVIN